nr:thiaminase II [Pseudovibrio flavus]
MKTVNAQSWERYCDHEFTRGLADGTLPLAAFQKYLVQDFLFLIDFARAYALSIYKSHSLEEMRKGLEGVKAILDVEINLHLRLCERWGLTEKDIENAPHELATLSYTQYVLETGNRGDLLDLKIALAPCVIGYGEIAANLAKVPGALDNSNPYAEWIKEYSSPEYQEHMHGAIAELEGLAQRYLTDNRRERAHKIFKTATDLEANFWQMGLEG